MNAATENHVATTFEDIRPLLIPLYGDDASVHFEGYYDGGREYRYKLIAEWGKRDADDEPEFSEVLAVDLLSPLQGYAEAKPILEARIAKRDAEPFRFAVENAAKELFTDLGPLRVTVGQADDEGDEAWVAELIVERRRVNFPDKVEPGRTPVVALARLLTWMEHEHANRASAIRTTLRAARLALVTGKAAA